MATMQPKVSSPEPTQPIASPPPAYADNGPRPQQSQQPMMAHPTPLNGLGATPALIDCPFCHRRTQTRVVEEDSSMTIVSGVAIAFLCICLACLPCILHWFQNVDHFCTGCNQRVVHIPHDGVPQVIQPLQIPQQYNMGNSQQYDAQHAQRQQQPFALQQQPPQKQPTEGEPPSYS